MKTVPQNSPSQPKSGFFMYFSLFAILLLYVLIYFFHLFQPTDYDLGWHLRYGKDVLTDGIIWRTNTYSTDLVGYKWIHSSWLLDILRYDLYVKYGMEGIAVVGGLTIVLTFFLIAKAFDFTLWQSIFTLPILSLVMYAVNVHSLRGQEVSFLFTALVIYLIRKYEKQIYSKTQNFEFRISNFILYLTLPLSLIGTNLNGQFVLGLGIYGLWVAVSLIAQLVTFQYDRFKIRLPRLKFFIVTLIIPSLLSVGITLVNPYGLHLYIEEFYHGESKAIQFISEWVPISASSGIVWYFLLAWGLVFLLVIPILIYKSIFIRYLPYLLFSIILYVASFFQGRYVWTMFLISSPLLALILGYLNPKKNIISTLILAIALAGLTAYLAIYELPHKNLNNLSWDTFCSMNRCSKQGAEFLIERYPNEKIWTDYNYGGWLIWNYPQIKPSMDGRMPLWVDPITHYSAFMETYYPLETAQADPDKSKYNVFFVQNFRPLKKSLDDLIQTRKWRIVFQDEFASIYVREKIRL